MTLIMGVRCRNGIVMGADSAATFASSDGDYTIRSERIKKLRTIEGKIIMGSAGSVAVSQRIAPVVASIWKREIGNAKGQIPPIGNLEAYDAAGLIRDVLAEKVYRAEIGAAGLAESAGWRAAAREAFSTTMLAFPVKTGAALFTFNAVGLPEEMTETLYCCNMGSGQGIADPFMGFMRRVLWDDKMPSVEQATLGVIWCLDHAIALHPGGVAGHVQVAVLEKKGTHWEASELDESKCEEHRQNAAVAERLLRDWHAGKLTKEAPPPPAPPASSSDAPKG